MPVLDATFLIDLVRRPVRARPMLDHLVDLEEDLVVPVQAAIEYATGESDEHAAFRAMGGSFRIAPLTDEIGRIAARLARDAFRAGRFPGWADAQIAATAVHEGMPLVTRNAADFLAWRIEVWDYEASPGPPSSG